MTFFTGVVRPTATATSAAGLRAVGPGANFVDGMLGRIKGGNFFEFDAASMAADDGSTVLKPDSIGGGSPGRWLIIPVSGSSLFTRETVPSVFLHPTTSSDPLVIGSATQPVAGEKLRVAGDGRVEGTLHVDPTGVFGATLKFGNNPSTAGQVRLNHGVEIGWRGLFKTGVIGISVPSFTDDILIGHGTGATAPGNITHDIASGGAHTFKVANVDKFLVNAAGVAADGTTGHFFAIAGVAKVAINATGTDFQSTEAKTSGSFRLDGSGFLRAGNTPAGSGRIRLTVNDQVNASLNGGDRTIIETSTFFATNSLDIGGTHAAANQFTETIIRATDTVEFNLSGTPAFRATAPELLSLIPKLNFGFTDFEIQRGSVTRVAAIGNDNVYSGLNTGNHAFLLNAVEVFQVSQLGVLTSVPLLEFAVGVTGPIIGHKKTSGTPQNLLLRAQGKDTGAGDGAALLLQGGKAGSGGGQSGGVRMQINNADASNGHTLVEAVGIGGRYVVGLARGAELTSTHMPAGSGHGVINVANATTQPTANPDSSGIVLWSGGGTGSQLRARDVSGGITSLSYRRGTTTGYTTLECERLCASIRTTNATPASLVEVFVPDNSVVTVVFNITARNAGASEHAGYHGSHAAFRRGGAATVIGAAVFDAFEQDATWDVQTDTSGNNFRVLAVGEAANNIDWAGWIDVYISTV